jgi:hypothetical protein
VCAFLGRSTAFSTENAVCFAREEFRNKKRSCLNTYCVTLLRESYGDEFGAPTFAELQIRLAFLRPIKQKEDALIMFCCDNRHSRCFLCDQLGYEYKISIWADHKIVPEKSLAPDTTRWKLSFEIRNVNYYFCKVLGALCEVYSLQKSSRKTQFIKYYIATWANSCVRDDQKTK